MNWLSNYHFFILISAHYIRNEHLFYHSSLLIDAATMQ